MTIRTIVSLTFRALRHPLETAICALLIAMTVVVFSQVIARYVLQAPLSWSEELARFLLMWLSMLSATYAFKAKSHFALMFLVRKFSGAAQRVMALFVHAVVAAFFGVLLYFSVIFVSGVEGHTAPALQIPMQIPYASIVVGCALILFETFRSAWIVLMGTAMELEE